MISTGIIQAVEESEWVSPMVVQDKKAKGEIRIYVDLRKLNDASVHDPFPTPFTDELLDEPVLGVDASTVSRDYGEISTALGVGVVSSTNEETAPKYFYQAVYGTSSETFNKLASYIRVAQELAALRYACASDHWVMYDGSFTALNMELCV